MSITGRSDRLRTLLETQLAISSELTIEAVLARIVEAAAGVTGARYAALGVIDPAGTSLDRFITYGVDADTEKAIGPRPRGRGILGALIRDARTLRLHDLGADPRSVGFPPGHPPMRTFLGTPIRLRGVVYGNLYLTEKEGGADFDEDDEELVTILAAQAAVAIENARLYESAMSWSRQLESLNEIGGALAEELDLGRLLDLIAGRLRELIGARVVAIAIPDGTTLRLESVSGEVDDLLRGMEIPAESKISRVLARGRSERVDDLIDDFEVVQEVARRFNATTGLYVPLLAGENRIGIVFAHDKLGADPRFSNADLRLAEQFAQRAAIALNLSRRVARDALLRLVEGQELERRRLARELHDETGQALTSMLLGLRAVEDASSPEQMRTAAAELRELVVSTLQDVRRLAVELRPKALDDFGLTEAVEHLAQTFRESSGIDVKLEARLGDTRPPAALETTLYRVIQEALTNVAKHAEAKQVSILLLRTPAALTAIVEDDGRGFTPGRSGRTDSIGLEGMRERVELIGGTLAVESAPGRGTTIRAELPL